MNEKWSKEIHREVVIWEYNALPSSEQNGRFYSEGRFIYDGRPVTLKSPSERFHKLFFKVAGGIYQIAWQTKRYLPSSLLMTLREPEVERIIMSVAQIL